MGYSHHSSLNAFPVLLTVETDIYSIGYILSGVILFEIFLNKHNTCVKFV